MNPSGYLTDFILKMKKEGLLPLVIDTFSYYYNQILAGKTGMISEQEIRPVESNEMIDCTDLKDYTHAGKKALKHAVMIVLNGGLGTSMALNCPKSLLKIRNDRTFLDIIVRQVESENIRLILMNSFNTHEKTLSFLSDINACPAIFLQHRFPKILKENYMPAYWQNNPALEWNPPGHGDIYTALSTSGMINRLLDDGLHYAFICNSDNLGAVIDTGMLGYFSENRLPFMMEVTKRSLSDAKGGHIARNKDGRLILREIAQCKDEDRYAFSDINRHKFFNTNNLWVDLRAVWDMMGINKTARLPMILNHKNLDPRDEKSPMVLQIETAMGAAISLFDGAAGVKVSRSRFMPVKKCNDLLAIRSDRFIFSKNRLILNPICASETISINLDPKYYGKVEMFNERFKYGVPSLVECVSLVIEGDVFFEKNVKIKGCAVIRNMAASPAVIREGTLISGQLIIKK